MLLGPEPFAIDAEFFFLVVNRGVAVEERRLISDMNQFLCVRTWGLNLTDGRGGGWLGAGVRSCSVNSQNLSRSFVSGEADSDRLPPAPLMNLVPVE